MAVTSGNYGNLYDARINKVYYNYLYRHPEEFTQWCERLSSKSQYEKRALYGEMPMPTEVGEYENAPEVEFVEGPVRTWTHKKYASTLIASRESLDDERFPVIEGMAGSLGKASNLRYETQGAYDLNNSFTVSTVGASDTADETLCDTSHATFSGAGGSAQANRPTTDVTLGADSLWAGVNNFNGLKDHEGNPVLIKPTKVIVPPALERTIIEILKSVETPYKATNEINAIRTRGLSYFIAHYLDSSTAWWIIGDEKPIIFFERQAPDVVPETTGRNSSKEWTVSFRISHAPYDWYQIYGTDGAP
ncbi:MAG: Mu-like prophage major head subunit gpT family protein [Dehalococcoidales bacterium]|nr:Mu-like prophage major head subunit gpT family protein [Dehalococcoidales bacterium]